MLKYLLLPTGEIFIANCQQCKSLVTYTAICPICLVVKSTVELVPIFHFSDIFLIYFPPLSVFLASKRHIVKRFPILTPFFVATVAASASVPGA